MLCYVMLVYVSEYNGVAFRLILHHLVVLCFIRLLQASFASLEISAGRRGEYPKLSADAVS